MTKKRDANDLVREGKPLDPKSSETLTLEVDNRNKCGGLDLDRSENGFVRSTMRNAITLLSEHPRWLGVIGLDLRAESTCFLRKPPAFAGDAKAFPCPITNVDETAIIAWLGQQTGAEFPEGKVARSVNLVARKNAFDPVAQYLEGLRWDCQSRLDEWLATYMGAPASDYARLVGTKFLISGVARSLTPGCQVDHVLVMEGAQGIGKTSALRILAGAYHRADPPPLGTRDAKEALRGCWIVEMGELDSMNRSEVSAVKNYLSETRDHYRAAYDRRAETHLRRVIFAATTNDTEYLRDATGNRRFWPIACASVDLHGLARDRDQLWAEAVVRFRRGEPWHMTNRAEHDLATHEQDSRVEVDPWEERIADLVAMHDEVSVTTILERLGVTLDRQGQREKNRVARILQRLGYRRHQVRDGLKKPYVYRREPGASGFPRATLSPVSPVSASDPELSMGTSVSLARTGDSGDTRPDKPRGPP